MSRRRLAVATLVVCLAPLAGPERAAGQDDAGPASGTPAATATPVDGLGEGEAAKGKPVAEVDDGRTPRERYNEGLNLYEGGDWSAASEVLLRARDQAGPDPELRFRAAFNLGMAHALSVDAADVESPDARGPQEKIDALRQSAAWFRDAVRLRPDDDDARVNLEVVLRRIQLLADELNKGQNRLEARLDRVIDDQRGLRDQVRKLLARIEQAGQSTEPIAFAPEFERLETFERPLGAEVGTISDLAAEERDLLEGKPEGERSDQERSRIVQLTNLDRYLQRARQSLSDTRLRLRRLQGDGAHRRADAALAELKRAREQLQDPIAVLKGVVEDETVLAMHTQALGELRKGAIRIGEDRPPLTPPPWLTGEHLVERQQDLAQRTGEVHGRLEAGVGAAEAAPDEAVKGADPGPADDPQRQRMIEAARAALPFLERALGAMQNVVAHIAADQLDDALTGERDALEALVGAIERFAGVRDLIELAHGEQTQAVALLNPDRAAAGSAAGEEPLSTPERMRRIEQGVGRNRDRLARLRELLPEEMERTLRPEAEAAPPAGGEAKELTEEQKSSIRQRYQAAEELRTVADAALARLSAALKAPDVAAGGSIGEARRAADEAMTKIEELRRLFFTIVEHLKDLLREQTDTHDQTASAQGAGAEERDAQVGPLADGQARHASIADTLALALGEQADAAAAGGDEQAQQAAQSLAMAVSEVRGASGDMVDASAMLDEAVDSRGVESDLEPVLEHQQSAMEHLEKAIQILDPHAQQPQPQDQQGDQGQQGEQGEQQQQGQPEPDEQLSQRQAERRLQAIRDREAERQRSRQERQQGQPEPVEKDW